MTAKHAGLVLAAIGGLGVGCTGMIPGGEEEQGGATGGSSAAGAGPTGTTPTGMTPAGVTPTGGTPTGTPSSNPPTAAPMVQPTQPVACTPAGDGAGPRRLWRISDTQYRNSLIALLAGRPVAGRVSTVAGGTAGMAAPFATDSDGFRFKNYAIGYSLADAEFRRSLDVSFDVSGRLVTQLRKEPGSCLGGAKSPFADCMRTLATDRGSILFRRPLTPEELTQYVTLATAQTTTLGEDEAAALMIQAMLNSPFFLYRSELGQGQPDAAGLVRLTPYELAGALALTITDAPADDVLWKAAETGALASADQIRDQIRRLVGPLGSRSTVLQFFRQYFEYPRAVGVFKDPKLFPGHNATALIDDTDLLVGDILATKGTGGLMAELFTGSNGFVRSSTAMNYGMAAVKEPKAQRMTFPAGQRTGLLGQPSFLVTFSGSDATDPVRRGRFISESLLCRPVPELPIGQVPPLADLGPNATQRDRLKAHTKDPSCAACHKFMDPLGLGLEGFDHLGRVRATEGNRPVDATGEVSDSGNQNGAFTGLTELSSKLAASSVVEECFVRHSFRYWMGRDESPADSCALAAAQNGLRTNGGDYLSLMLALGTSKSFLYRNAR